MQPSWLLLAVLQVILGDKIRPDEQHTGGYKLQKSGEVLQADLVYWCVGQQPCSSFLKASHPQVLNEAGYIKVGQ